VLNPFTDVEMKRSTDIGRELVAVNVNKQIVDGVQQQKLHKQTTTLSAQPDADNCVMVAAFYIVNQAMLRTSLQMLLMHATVFQPVSLQLLPWLSSTDN